MPPPELVHLLHDSSCILQVNLEFTSTLVQNSQLIPLINALYLKYAAGEIICHWQFELNFVDLHLIFFNQFQNS